MRNSSEIEKLERRWMDNPMGVTFAPLAEAYRRAGDHGRALEVLAIGLSQHPAYVPALIVQARCHLDTKTDRAAEESFQAVLQSDPHNLIALKGLADICERTERAGEAHGFLTRLLDADPSHEEARQQHARVATLLAEREAIRASGAAPAVGREPEAPGMMPDLELTAHIESEPDDPATIASLLEPEEPSALAVTVDETPVSLVDSAEFAIERETSPFESSEASEWSSPAAEGIVVPDLPFEEQATAPAMEDVSRSAEWVEEPLGASSDALPDAFAESTSLPLDGDPENAPMADPQPEPITSEAGQASPLLPLEESGHFALPAAATGEESASEPAAALVVETIETFDHPFADDPISAAAEGLDPVVEGEWEAGPEEQPVVTAGWIAGFGHSEFVPDLDAAAPAEPPVIPAESTAAAPPSIATDPTPGFEGTSESAPPVEAETEPAAELTAPADLSDEVPAPAVLAAPHVASANPVVESDLDDVVVVEGAEAEAPTDAPEEPGTAEPELVITETMAEVFLRQGHRALALAVYAQLAEKDPGNSRLLEAVSRLKGELAPPAGGGPTGSGETVGAFLARVLSSEAAPTPAPIAFQPIEPATAGAPTQPASDPLSLSAIFGDDPLLAAVAAPPAAGEAESEAGPSFDEFFGPTHAGHGSPGPAVTTSAAEEDLEQFNSWLRGLKR